MINGNLRELSKRELFAILAMQVKLREIRLSQCWDLKEYVAMVAEQSVTVADALLAELEKTK